MRRGPKKLHENQHLVGRAGSNSAAQRGVSVPVIQSADAADGVGKAQPPRLSSAWANNSASFEVVSSGEEHQPVQHARDRRAPCRQGIALARPAGNS
jgi:hypothetical protein